MQINAPTLGFLGLLGFLSVAVLLPQDASAQGLEAAPGPSFAANELPISTDWSPDGEYLAVSFQNTTGSNRLRIFETTNWTVASNPAAQPPFNATTTLYAPSGAYLAVGGIGSQGSEGGFAVYKISGTTYTKLADIPVSNSTDPLRLDWSPNSVYLALANLTPTAETLVVVKVDDITLSKVNPPDTFPEAATRAVAFNPRGSFLAVGGLNDNGTNGILYVYRFTGINLYLHQELPYLGANDDINRTDFIIYTDIQYSPSGDFLIAVGGTQTPNEFSPPPIQIFRNTGGILVPAGLPTKLPYGGGGAGAGYRINWGAEGDRVGFAAIGQPPLSAYLRVGGILMATPAITPNPESAWGFDFSWAPDGQRAAGIILNAEDSFFNVTSSSLVVYNVSGQLEAVLVGLTGTGNSTIIQLLITGINDIFGFEGTQKAGWLLGTGLIIGIMYVFKRHGSNPLVAGLGALLGMGLALFIGFTPLWLLLTTILFTIGAVMAESRVSSNGVPQ